MSNFNSTKEWQEMYGDLVSEKVATKPTTEYSRKPVKLKYIQPDDGWDNNFAGTENFAIYNNKKS
jgi:hypothetical protein|tara:strand:+ start:447 stop:641 length:195 start_codon:yes stop_codon:yes gene_type:complete